MSLNVSLHDATNLNAHRFVSGGKEHGCAEFYDKDGRRVDIYVPPHVADALKEAFDAAMADEATEAA